MPSFSYIARTQDGTLQKGELTASSPEAAREQLRKQHLMIEELREETDGAPAVGFAGAMPWTTTDDEDVAPTNTPADATAQTDPSYLPLSDTLRLFAGWLLAWYALVYLLGSFRHSGKLPFDVPFLQGLFESPLVLRFSFATFLFLLLSTVHRWLGKGTGAGILLGLFGIILFILFHLNA